MKVRELIKKLQKMDQELDIVTRDNDYWWYDTYDIRTLYVKAGREITNDKFNEDEVFCVGIS